MRIGGREVEALAGALRNELPRVKRRRGVDEVDAPLHGAGEATGRRLECGDRLADSIAIARRAALGREALLEEDGKAARLVNELQRADVGNTKVAAVRPAPGR